MCVIFGDVTDFWIIVLLWRIFHLQGSDDRHDVGTSVVLQPYKCYLEWWKPPNILMMGFFSPQKWHFTRFIVQHIRQIKSLGFISLLTEICVWCCIFMDIQRLCWKKTKRAAFDFKTCRLVYSLDKIRWECANVTWISKCCVVKGPLDGSSVKQAWRLRDRRAAALKGKKTKMPNW